MPLESCMLVLDNSEYMRNGDYAPTRFQAQAQAVSTVFTAKTDSNPESAVGLMTMAGKAPQLLVTPTNDIGKLLSALNKSQVGGLPQLSTAVQIAQLALKHRENKNQRQRIVVFVGSPLEDSQDSLVKLGKRLRKNNVLVDVVTFGEEGMGNDEKLGALVEAAGAGDSHLVSIPPGLSLLSDAIISSPILFDPELANIGQGASGEAGGSGGVGGGDMLAELENTDPELAMAIRMSLQETEPAAARSAPAAEAAPAADAPAQASSSTAEPTAAAALPASMTQPISNANDAAVPAASGDISPEQQPLLGADAQMDEDEEDDEDEDEMLRRAMALSRGEDGGEDVLMGDEDEDEDEEAEIARAIALSMEENKGPEGKDEAKK